MSHALVPASVARWIATAGPAVCLIAALGSCGSQLPPGEVAQANGAAGTGAAASPGEPGTGVGAPSSAASVGGEPAAAGGGLPAPSPGAGVLGGGAGAGSGGASSGGGASTAGSPTHHHPTSGGGTGTASSSGGKAADCAGFDDAQPGVTSDTITIANVADVSGPVPGVFESARLATQAFAAYFNSTGDICGHKLAVDALDSRTEAGADQQAYATACEHDFAAVGSMSAFDYGGAPTAAACGLPDLHSTSVSTAVTDCPTCFSAQGAAINLVPSTLPRFFANRFGDAVKHAAVLYMDAQAGEVNAHSFEVAFERNGWQVDLFEGIDVSSFNYAPYVQQLKDGGIETVVFLGAPEETVRLQQAMAQQDYRPTVFAQDATIYNQGYVAQAGGLGDGTYTFTSTGQIDDPSNQEMALYQSWLQQVHPGAVPDEYGVYAWSAARLFTEAALRLGGRLTRASLVHALAGVRDWTDHGMHGPEPVGVKQTDHCVAVLQLDGAAWRKVSPGSFMCGPLTDTGVKE